MEMLEFQMIKFKVYVFVSGVVEEVYLKSGELVFLGMFIVQLLNFNWLKVVVDVFEFYLCVVKQGEQVKVVFFVLDEEQMAIIIMIGCIIDFFNWIFDVEVWILVFSLLIKFNLLVMMFIKDKEVEDVVIIFLEMVQQEVGGKDYVYILEDSNFGVFV